MEIKILEEAGFECAMKGLSLSYNKDPKDMEEVASKLSRLGKGHGKFLESMVVWLEVTAPLDFHIQLDTYRVGMTKQSESTMHTLKNRLLIQEDFEVNIPNSYLTYLNSCIEGNAPIEFLKKMLPCGFLQKRILCTNYMTLRNIIVQRSKHKLPEWKSFIQALEGLKYYRYINENTVL